MTPDDSSWRAAGEAGLRVMPRTSHPGIRENVLATDPPYAIVSCRKSRHVNFFFEDTNLSTSSPNNGDYLTDVCV